MIAKHVFGNAKNQALLIAAFLIVLTAVLVQFFFLGEELEESRSRAAKLSIAEIIAKNQQQNRVQQASYTADNNEFARVAATAVRVQTGDPATDFNQVNEDNRKRVSEELHSFSNKVDLQGIIKNERYSMAIVQVAGEKQTKTLSHGADLGNGISVSQVRQDSVIFAKQGVHVAVRMNGNPPVEVDASALGLLGQ